MQSESLNTHTFQLAKKILYRDQLCKNKCGIPLHDENIGSHLA